MAFRVRAASIGYELMDGDRVVSVHGTNAEAWRHADRLSFEPTSRREELSEWVSRRNDE